MTVRFRYQAATLDGDTVEGVVQAASRQSVLEELRRRQLYAVTVGEATPDRVARAGRRLGRRAGAARSTRNGAPLLTAGVPPARALAFTDRPATQHGLAEPVTQ